jgi:hypothetical protein
VPESTTGGEDGDRYRDREHARKGTCCVMCVVFVAVSWRTRTRAGVHMHVARVRVGCVGGAAGLAFRPSSAVEQNRLECLPAALLAAPSAGQADVGQHIQPRM